MTLLTIQDRIESYLDELVGSKKPFAKRYGYFEPDPDAFPCVMIWHTTTDIERLDFGADGGSNMWIDQYQIKILLRERNNETNENLRTEAIQAVLNRLFQKSDASETLGGVANKVELESLSKYDERDGQFPIMVADITLAVSHQQQIVA